MTQTIGTHYLIGQNSAKEPEMTGEIQVYHHLGLGDHIVCNGLVRKLCTRHPVVYCFVKRHHLSSVAFMYRDEPRIRLIPVEGDWEVPSNTNKDVPMIKIGFEKMDRSINNFDECFYNQLGYDFNLRWANFHVQRDYDLEWELFRKLNPSNEPYIFIHDDPSRSLVVDLSVIRKDLKFIKASDYSVIGRVKENFEKYTIFHWILTLEKAQEIHCMDSAFRCLVESLPNLEHPKLVFHRYIKGPREVCTTQKQWTVIKRPSPCFLAKSSIYRLHRKIMNKWQSKINGPRRETIEVG